MCVRACVRVCVRACVHARINGRVPFTMIGFRESLSPSYICHTGLKTLMLSAITAFEASYLKSTLTASRMARY